MTTFPQSSRKNSSPHNALGDPKHHMNVFVDNVMYLYPGYMVIKDEQVIVYHSINAIVCNLAGNYT
jgi:hypothetical protein